MEATILSSDTNNASSGSSSAPDPSWWSAGQYNKTASFVYSDSFVAPVLALLEAQPGQRIFDFGCGSGEVTVQIAEAVGKDGLVVGVDHSESMVDKARANGIQYAFACDIQRLVVPESPPWGNGVMFDAVFSNACLHWCKCDPRGVLESVKKVLKPGGRFVGEMGGYMNCIGIRSALHAALKKRGHDPVAIDPWHFPSVAGYRKLLASTGFDPIHVSLHPRVTPLPEGFLSFLQYFVRNSFLRNFDDQAAAEIMQEVVNVCEVDCKDEEGNWTIICMRLRFCAVLLDT